MPNNPHAISWNSEEFEKLVELVKPHSCLYNVQDPSRKTILARESTWEKISRELGKPGKTTVIFVYKIIVRLVIVFLISKPEGSFCTCKAIIQNLPRKMLYKLYLPTLYKLYLQPSKLCLANVLTY